MASFRGLKAAALITTALASSASAAPRQAGVEDMIGFSFDYHSWNVSAENVQRFARMGGRIARIPFRWEELEPSDDVWSWARTDAAVALFAANGIRVFGILGNPPVTPSWIDRSQFRTQDALPHLDEWLDYVRQVVMRYEDDVNVWEIGNEQFTALQQMVPLDQYAAFLQASYLEAKAIDPLCTVLMGALRHQNDLWQIQQYIVQPGAGAYTDGINFHTLYVGPGQPEEYGYEPALFALENFAVRNGMNTDLHLTESAWASHNTIGKTSYFYTENDYVSEPLQAAYSVRTVILGLAHPMMKSVVHAWTVNDSPNAWWQSSWWYWSDTGFIREDGTEKSAYFATQFLHETLSGASFTANPSVNGTIQKFEFERPDAYVTVYWTTGYSETASYMARTMNHVPEFFDQVGDSLPSPSQTDDSYAFTVTKTPVYVIESRDPVSEHHDRSAVTVTFGDGTTGPLRQILGPRGQVTNGELLISGFSPMTATLFTVPEALYGDRQSLALRVEAGMPQESFISFLVRSATETASPWANGPQTLIGLKRTQPFGQAVVIVWRYDSNQGVIVSTEGPLLGTNLATQAAVFTVRVEADRVRAWVNGELGIDLAGISNPVQGGRSALYSHVNPDYPGTIPVDYVAIRDGDRGADISFERDGKVFLSILQKDLLSTYDSRQFAYVEQAPGGALTTYNASEWLLQIATPPATWEAFEEDLMIAEIHPAGSQPGLEVGTLYGSNSPEAEILP